MHRQEIFLQIIFCLIANYNFCQDIKSNRIKKLNSGPYRNHPLRSSSFLSPPHILSQKSSKSSDLLLKCQTRTSSFLFTSSPSPIPRKQRKTYHFQHIRKESPAAALPYLRDSHSRTSSFPSISLLIPIK